MGDLIAAAIMQTLSRWGFRHDALREVGRLIREADPEDLEHVHILRGKLSPDGKADFTLINDDAPEYPELIAKGASLEINLKDYVLGVLDRLREMGFDVLAQARKEMN